MMAFSRETQDGSSIQHFWPNIVMKASAFGIALTCWGLSLSNMWMVLKSLPLVSGLIASPPFTTWCGKLASDQSVQRSQSLVYCMLAFAIQSTNNLLHDLLGCHLLYWLNWQLIPWLDSNVRVRNILGQERRLWHCIFLKIHNASGLS